MEIKPLRTVFIGRDGEILQRLIDEFEKKRGQFTLYELESVRHAIIDCESGNNTESLSDSPYYHLTKRIYTLLTDTQKEILSLWVNGNSKASIRRLKGYKSTRTVSDHLEAIKKKAFKVFRTLSEKELIELELLEKKPTEPIIIDAYLNKFDTDDSVSWFLREIVEDNFSEGDENGTKRKHFC